MFVQPIHISQAQVIPIQKGNYDIFTPKEPSEQSSDYIITPLDTLQAYGNVSFNGFSCEMKRLYKKGKLKIKYSFYGGRLDPKQFSTEHVIPKSKGGQSIQENYVFCNAWQNSERGDKPLVNYIDWKAVGIYLDQFKGVKVGMFNGDEYINQVLNSINEAIKTGR